MPLGITLLLPHKARNLFRRWRMERESKLCDACKYLFNHWYDRREWDSHRPYHCHRDIFRLMESVQSGCPVCTLFLNTLGAGIIHRLCSSDERRKSNVLVVSAYAEVYLVHLIFSLEFEAKATVVIFPGDSMSLMAGVVYLKTN